MQPTAGLGDHTPARKYDPAVTAEAIYTISLQDYLDGEERTDRKHEWVAGRIYVMAGGTERHDLASGLVYEALAPAARRRGCRPFQQNRKVKIGEHVYIPDVMVICKGGPLPEQQYERDLSIVVEVLSPSTSTIDRREKAPVYHAADGFVAYALVDPDTRRIELATDDRGEVHWQVYGPGDVVPHLDLDVDDLYDQLDATALT